MTTDDIILHIFHLVATSLPEILAHGFASQAKLYPSELVTIGILFALKGAYFRAFHRRLDRQAGSVILVVSQLLPTFSSNLNRQGREIP